MVAKKIKKHVPSKGKTKLQTGFKLSKTMHNKLPDSEKAIAEQKLVEKSGGLCALCNQPLGSEPEHIVADHRIPESKMGKTTINNLYLAHKSCNSSRRDLDFEVAQPIVQFKVYSEDKAAVTFDDVLENYVSGSSRQIKYARKDNYAVVSFGSSNKVTCPVFSDPATNVEYFFCDVPIEFICNDPEVQPRLISYGHVRTLALDFLVRPVHEPSNCRLVSTGTSTAELKQFDGQHKTTAQILLKRKTVQVKIYIEPDIALLQALVVKIQQEIKKQPLTRSDTLAKLGDVMKSVFEDYRVPDGFIRTETGLVESQIKDKRAEVKKLYIDELKRIIFWDDDNDIRDWVRPGAKHAPTTDKQVIDKIISKMVFPNPLESIDLDKEGGRDIERRLIHVVLNTITKKMLPLNWYEESNKFQRHRTVTFFLGGAITWWVGEILIPTLRLLLQRVGDSNRKPLFIDNITADQESIIIDAVEALCDWEIWSTQDSEILKAFRSNTLKNVLAVVGGYDQIKLMKDVST